MSTQSALFGATDLVIPFENLRMTDVEAVGGKNASLGEMISQLPTGPKGVQVPTGFATSAHAFREFLAFDGLDQKINAVLDALDTEDVRALAEAGSKIRSLVESQPFPPLFEQAVRESFATLMTSSLEIAMPLPLHGESCAFVICKIFHYLGSSTQVLGVSRYTNK